MRSEQSNVEKEVASEDVSVTKESVTPAATFKSSSGWMTETGHETIFEGSGESGSGNGTMYGNELLFTVGKLSSEMTSKHESAEKTTVHPDSGVRSHSGPTSSAEDVPEKVALSKCAAANQSICHELAFCLEESGECVCKLGYRGDGYSICMLVDFQLFQLV